MATMGFAGYKLGSLSMQGELSYIERKQLTHLVMLAGGEHRLEISTWVNTECCVAAVWIKLVNFSPMAAFPDLEMDLEQLLETGYFSAPDDSYRLASSLQLESGVALMDWVIQHSADLHAIAESHLTVAMAEIQDMKAMHGSSLAH